MAQLGFFWRAKPDHQRLVPYKPKVAVAKTGYFWVGGEGGAVLQLQRFSRSDSDGFSRHQVSWCCTDLEAFLTQVRSILQQQTTHWLTTTEVSQVKVCLQPLVGCNRLEKRFTIAAIMAEFKSFPSMCKHSTQNFSKMTCIRTRWIHTLNMWEKYVYIYIYTDNIASSIVYVLGDQKHTSEPMWVSISPSQRVSPLWCRQPAHHQVRNRGGLHRFSLTLVHLHRGNVGDKRYQVDLRI